MTTELLFVYGSLKRNGRHHAKLRGAPFLGEARTAPGYALVQVGDYLALVEEPGAASVPGELFEVDRALLSELDEFEGEQFTRAALHVMSMTATPRASETQIGENFLALAYVKRTC